MVVRAASWQMTVHPRPYACSHLLLFLTPLLQYSCEGGEKEPGFARALAAATPCGETYFRACSDRADKLDEPCASFKGDVKCALKDFKGIYEGEP